ncbi:hypothetical protein F4679DRAFT_476412 [Xylaria curta]|nr:hypothetical protein F4679DRAFT_476412 [Xylaria curta]
MNTINMLSLFITVSQCCGARECFFLADPRAVQPLSRYLKPRFADYSPYLALAKVSMKCPGDIIEISDHMSPCVENDHRVQRPEFVACIRRAAFDEV